jgi:hypothetical protein
MRGQFFCAIPKAGFMRTQLIVVAFIRAGVITRI